MPRFEHRFSMTQMPFDHINDKLLVHYGPPPKLSGDSPWERLIVAVLAQRASPAAVSERLDKLREADLVSPLSVFDIDPEDLAELLGPATAAKLRKLARWLIDQHQGDATRALTLDTETLRDELTAINGIGPATAAAIVLHAARASYFVVDRAAHRVFKRHGWFDFDADDAEIQASVEAGLAGGPQRLGRFHLLIQRVGHDFCGTRPRCAECPLGELLPEGGPREPEL